MRVIPKQILQSSHAIYFVVYLTVNKLKEYRNCHFEIAIWRMSHKTQTAQIVEQLNYIIHLNWEV